MKKLSYALSTQPLSFIKLQLFSSISFFPVRNVQLSFEIKNYDKKIISVRKSVSIYFNGFSHDGNIFNYFLQHSKSFFFLKILSTFHYQLNHKSGNEKFLKKSEILRACHKQKYRLESDKQYLKLKAKKP
jgi:hypothetical protein